MWVEGDEKSIERDEISQMSFFAASPKRLTEILTPAGAESIPWRDRVAEVESVLLGFHYTCHRLSFEQLRFESVIVLSMYVCIYIYIYSYTYINIYIYIFIYLLIVYNPLCKVGLGSWHWKFHRQPCMPNWQHSGK